MELSIEYLSIDNLTQYNKNAREHKDTDINAIAKSIKEFGFDDPIGIWSEENIIVEGHGRLLAAKKLGMKTVPCIRLDHLSDEQRRAYALAHNKTAEQTGRVCYMSELDPRYVDVIIKRYEMFTGDTACLIDDFSV